jgi:hypothetical protein
VSKFYLAGPMSGLPRSNFEMFDHVAAVLRSRGHEVISPADLDRGLGIDPDDPSTLEGIDWAEVMRMDLKHVLDCDGIVLLPGWEKSSGARLERTVAESTGRMIWVWEDTLIAFTTPWLENDIIYHRGRRPWQFRGPAPTIVEADVC